MNINFFATLRQIVGQKTVEFDIPNGTTVRQLVEIVVTRFPPMRKELLDEDGNLWSHVHVFVNGRDSAYLENGIETVIKPTDTVNIFPAVGGGQAKTQLIEETHSIPLWLLRDYLEEIGGTAESEHRVTGDGWTATLIKLEPRRVGSLRVGQVKIEFEGQPDALTHMQSQFHKKTMRAGA